MKTTREQLKTLQNAIGAKAIVAVGSGRGFVVEGGNERYVITAAHCLPFLPPCHGFSHTEERTYHSLLAPLGKQPSVSCEVLFVDPVADIAVLGSPDNQTLSGKAYDALVAATTPLKIAEPPSKPIAEEVKSLKQFGMTGRARRQCAAFMLSLTNEWFSCTVQHRLDGMLSTSNAASGIDGGMSGSPIVTQDGTAIGIVCLSGSGPHPRLMGNLPGWFLAMCMKRTRNERISGHFPQKVGISQAAPRKRGGKPLRSQ